MIRLVLLFVSMLSINVAAQTKQFVLIQDIYNNWKKVYNDDHTCDTFLYADKIDKSIINSLQSIFEKKDDFYSKQDTFKADKIAFTIEEKNFILNEWQNMSSISWPDKMFSNSRIIDHNKIDSLQTSVIDNKLDPVAGLCYTVFTFSHPILLRDSSICVFYFGKTTYAMKEGEFWIYKKNDKYWTKFSRIVFWVN